MAKDSNVIAIESNVLTAVVNPFGAELTSLRDAEGRELMTEADPAFWAGRAPLLFPIVGRLGGDVLRVDGVEYPMRQHGFARRRRFEPVEQAAHRVRLRLVDDAETRAAYPFAFALDAEFALAGATLTIAIAIANPGEAPLPASFGFHPAFAWPLPYGARREEHRIVFDRDEPAPIKTIADGLIAGDRPSPLTGRTLALSDALFAEDALVWDPIASQSLTYGPPAGPSLRIDFPDTPQLALWTRPGARFLCVEPWHGHADPQGFAGDFRDKPGVFEVPPGGEWRCNMRVTLQP
jgi:galactose mutarotase-like enzyme